jgi:hypothetical protein
MLGRLTAGVVIRRCVLWRWRDGATPEQKLSAKEGLAYVSYASPVEAVDFGEDLGLVGGSNYGLALLRDHRDKASWDLYDTDPHHFRVGGFIDTLTHEELTARADYLYAGRTPRQGEVRHLALHSWREESSDAERAVARRALASLRADCPGLLALEVADDLGYAGAGRADLVVEAHFEDEEQAAGFLAHPAVAEVESLLAGLTEPTRTARIEHRVRSG